MPKTMVGARVPQEWADKLTEVAHIDGKTSITGDLPSHC